VEPVSAPGDLLTAEELAPLRRALARYRVMAYVVGTMLVLLVFVAIPLQYGANIPQMAVVVAPIHGYLYIVYLVTGADLARRAHWRLGRIILVVAAGFVPFVAFIVEHRVTRQMREEWGDRLVRPRGGSST
jgi:integral membrane protein